MRIVQIIYTLCSGGAEKFVVDLSNSLAKAGHEVTVVTLRKDTPDGALTFNAQFLSPEVRMVNMGLGNGFSLGMMRKVISGVKAMRPDIVHCHLNVVPFVYPWAAFAAKENVKFFYTLHSVAENTVGLKVQKHINRWFFKTGHLLPVTISKECQNSYESFYGLKNAPFINNGRSCDPPSPAFETVKKEVEELKKADGNEEGTVYIHVARCNPQKNQQLLIDSFNRLAQTGRPFTLLIIGQHFSTTEEGRKLMASACDKIHFLGEKSNVGDYLRVSDAFCLTSVYEGLPISLLEALAVGVTPVCTPVGGIPDVVEDGKTGYLSKGYTVEEYLDAVGRFEQRPLDRGTLQKFYAGHFSMDECARQYEELYQKALQP